MTIDITEYRLIGKRMTGQVFKLFFKKENTQIAEKVLELKNVVAIIDNIASQQLLLLEIRSTAGSYGSDMAIRLKRPEVASFNEVFIFTDKTLTNSIFRALTESANWRDFDNKPYGDINY